MAWGQYNIARARWDLEDPRMAEFVDTVDFMNDLARKQDGFMWLCEHEAEVKMRNFPNDPRMTMTLSKWRDLDSLRQFTWHTIHKRFRLRTREWFEDLGKRYLVMWEIPDAHEPGAAEALDNLLALRRDGPTATRKGTEALMPPAEATE